MRIKRTENIRKVFKIHKSSNSLRVTIPELAVFRMGLKQGDEVKMVCDLETKILFISKVEKNKNGKV